MKIYIQDIEIDKIDENLKKNNSIKNFEYKRKYYIMFYSPDGIFKLENENLCKLLQKDCIIEKDIINIEKGAKGEKNEKEIFYDKSFYINERIYSLPVKYIANELEEIYYKLNKKSFLSMVITYKNNTINDFYFYLQDDNTNNNNANFNKINIKEEISSFLSIIKNI